MVTKFPACSSEEERRTDNSVVVGSSPTKPIMNIDTMTLDEICDEIARRLGYRYVQSTNTASFPHWLDAESNYVHPIEQTLEEASKLPDHWKQYIEQYETGWTAKAVSWDHTKSTKLYEGCSELHVRFRVRLECMLLDRETAP